MNYVYFMDKENTKLISLLEVVLIRKNPVKRVSDEI